MMSFILLIIAGVVIYYLYTTFDEYIKNPLPTPNKPQERQEYTPLKENPYSLPSPKDKLQNSYAGASIAMLDMLLQAGTKSPSLLQIVLIDSFIKNMRLQDSQESMLRQMLKSVDFGALKSKNAKSTLANQAQKDAQENDTNAKDTNAESANLPSTNDEQDFAQTPQNASNQNQISALAQIFLDNTYGEYKKRVHFVGFALMLAWSDRELAETEQDVILDIAAFLQLENAEFNELYDSFENKFGNTQNDEAQNIQTKSSELIAQYTKELESKMQSQDNKNAQSAFEAIAQKLYAKAQVINEAQADLLEKLLALESAHNAKNA